MNVIYFLIILFLYHLWIIKKFIKPLRFKIEKIIEELETLKADVRFNNGEFVRRTDTMNRTFNKIKSEYGSNIKQNKNEITNLKSKFGKLK